MKAANGIHVVNDLAQLKAISHELRQDLLGAFSGEPKTTKQVADGLKQSPTKLYHHVDILEKAGLLKLIETKKKRGTTEKYYQAIASDFQIGEGKRMDKPAANGEESHAATRSEPKAVANVVIEPSFGGEEGESKALHIKTNLRLSPKGYRRFEDKLQAFLKGLNDDDSKKGKRYQVKVVLNRERELE